MDKTIEILVDQYAYDVEVMSQPWMYWCLLIPITLYMSFFFVKWVVLTAPAWLPLAVVVSLFRNR